MNNKAKKKIVIIGGFGCGNIGDEAMPRNDIIKLRQKNPDIDIVMLTRETKPEKTSQYHNEFAVCDIGTGYKKNKPKLLWISFVCIVKAFLVRYRMYELFKDNKQEAFYHIATADLIFNVGGGNLNTVVRTEVLRKMLVYKIAFILNIPVVLSGQTIGPFEDRFIPFFLGRLLNTVKYISLRDKFFSIKQLGKINVCKPEIEITCDDATSLPTVSEKESFSLLNNDVSEEWLKLEKDITIAINLKASMGLYKPKRNKGFLEKEKDLIINFTDKVTEKYNAKILFVPTSFETNNDDRLIHQEILERLKHPESSAVISSAYNDIQIKSILRHVDIAVGSRYHFLVFALAMNVPTIGVASSEYQQQKLKGILDIYEMEELYIDNDMEDVSTEELLAKFDDIVHKSHNLRHQLNLKNKKLGYLHLKSIDFAMSMLNRRNNK